MWAGSGWRLEWNGQGVLDLAVQSSILANALEESSPEFPHILALLTSQIVF